MGNPRREKRYTEHVSVLVTTKCHQSIKDLATKKNIVPAMVVREALYKGLEQLELESENG